MSFIPPPLCHQQVAPYLQLARSIFIPICTSHLYLERDTDNGLLILRGQTLWNTSPYPRILLRIFISFSASPYPPRYPHILRNTPVSFSISPHPSQHHIFLGLLLIFNPPGTAHPHAGHVFWLPACRGRFWLGEWAGLYVFWSQGAGGMVPNVVLYCTKKRRCLSVCSIDVFPFAISNSRSTEFVILGQKSERSCPSVNFKTTI